MFIVEMTCGKLLSRILFAARRHNFVVRRFRDPLLLIMLIANTVLLSGDVSPEVVKRLKQSSYRIEASMWGVSIGSGTGFSLGQSNILVTALHVIQGATSLKVTNLDSGSEYKVASILAIDRRLDTVRLSLASEGPNHLEVWKGDLSQGQGVLTYGNPIGLNASLGAGLIASIDSDRHGLIQINTAVSPGNSGGPITTYDGEVVGVVVSKISGHGAEGIAFAAPISRIANAPDMMLPLEGTTLYSKRSVH